MRLSDKFMIIILCFSNLLFISCNSSQSIVNEIKINRVDSLDISGSKVFFTNVSYSILKQNSPFSFSDSDKNQYYSIFRTVLNISNENKDTLLIDPDRFVLAIGKNETAGAKNTRNVLNKSGIIKVPPGYFDSFPLIWEIPYTFGLDDVTNYEISYSSDVN